MLTLVYFSQRSRLLALSLALRLQMLLGTPSKTQPSGVPLSRWRLDAAAQTGGGVEKGGEAKQTWAEPRPPTLR